LISILLIIWQIIIFVIWILLIIIKIIIFIVEIIIFRNLRPKNLGSWRRTQHAVLQTLCARVYTPQVAGLQTRLLGSTTSHAGLAPRAWQPQCQVSAARRMVWPWCLGPGSPAPGVCSLGPATPPKPELTIFSSSKKTIPSPYTLCNSLRQRQLYRLHRSNPQCF